VANHQIKKFAKELLKELSRKRNELSDNPRKERTKLVAEILQSMAEDGKFYLHPYKHKEIKRKQLLCDFVWLARESDSQTLSRVILAAESEWSRNKPAVLYDFKKLLLVKADRKLLFFRSAKTSKITHGDNIRAEIVEALEGFKQKTMGETYFIVEMNNRSRKFRLDYWITNLKGQVALQQHK